MAISSKHTRLQLVMGAVCLALGACGDTLQKEPTPYDELPVGRFVVVPVPGTRDMIQLDTGSGKTWALNWSDDGENGVYPSGWSALDSADIPYR